MMTYQGQGCRRGVHDRGSYSQKQLLKSKRNVCKKSERVGIHLVVHMQIQKNQAGAKFMVKYLNINFPLGSGSSSGGGGSGGGVRKVEFNPNKR